MLPVSLRERGTSRAYRTLVQATVLLVPHAMEGGEGRKGRRKAGREGLFLLIAKQWAFLASLHELPVAFLPPSQRLLKTSSRSFHMSLETVLHLLRTTFVKF